ncbi:MAG: PD-(D/E)XK motif protein [Candidatus Sericytochromatia bacterium]|nr:PD-(D/E)XK motif protein [Candidatus Sericytochromatia bacterium]
MSPADLEALWIELGRPSTRRDGDVRRRVHPESALDLFVARTLPAGEATFRVEVLYPVRPDHWKPANCEGVRVDWEVVAEGDAWRTYLVLTLLDEALLAVFARLCADLCDVMLERGEGAAALVAGLGRLDRWRLLLDGVRAEGMSTSRQSGLFGEMHVLDILLDHLPADFAVRGWQGFDQHLQDFRLGGLGIEVKTSEARQHVRIRIANERQLDERPWHRLLLACVLVDADVGTGTSLVDKVAALRARLDDEPGARRMLDDRLEEYGYLDAQARLYADRRLEVRRLLVLEVRDEFPRLTEAGVPAGVGDIRYSVVVTNLPEYEIAEDTFVRWLEEARP